MLQKPEDKPDLDGFQKIDFAQKLYPIYYSNWKVYLPLHGKKIKDENTLKTYSDRIKDMHAEEQKKNYLSALFNCDVVLE